MKLVACQYEIAWEDKAGNHRMLERWLREHRPAAGSLVVLPEMFATGFSMNVAGIAEGGARPSERWLAELAGELDVAMLGGVVNRAADGRGRNEALALAPDGRELARYAKLHPFSHAGEDEHFAAGDSLALFHWQGMTVCPIVCYDLRFPELFRHAVRGDGGGAGAELFVVIANWPAARAEHWRPLLRARAIENQAFVVGVNRCGADPNVAYQGDSIVCDPRGRVIAEAGDGPAMLQADIDRAALDAFRQRFAALNDMRADLLGPPPPIDTAER